MKIIICGAGQVGGQLARQLSGERNDVTVVDQNGELIRRITENLDTAEHDMRVSKYPRETAMYPKFSSFCRIPISLLAFSPSLQSRASIPPKPYPSLISCLARVCWEKDGRPG